MEQVPPIPSTPNPQRSRGTTRSLRRWLFRAVVAAFVLMAVAFGVLWGLNIGTAGARNDFGTRFTPVVLMVDGLAFSVVGWLIFSRRPDNAVGRVCLIIGLLMGVNCLAGEYAVYAVLTDPGSLPGGPVAAWITNWTWVLYIGGVGTVLVLLFPDGRLPSQRWRPLLALALVTMAMAATSFALTPGPFVSIPWATNPFGLEGTGPWLDAAALGFFLLAATIVAAAWSMVTRYRRAKGPLRQQIKWFASAASLLALTYVGQSVYSLVTGTLGDSTDGQRIVQTAVVATFGILAAAVGVAVLRYRLYQIDHVISRTVTYALITGTLGAVYVALVFGLGLVLPSESDLAVAASTLVVAALFAPVRRRIQEQVDRRFNRTRYDAVRTLELFSEQLRHGTDMAGLRMDLSHVTGRIMEPAHVSLWLKEPR